MNKIFSILIAAIVFMGINAHSKADELSTTWRVNDELLVVAGCIKYEDILEVAQLGVENDDEAMLLWSTKLEEDLCRIFPFPFPGKLVAWKIGPITMSSEPDYKGSIWEVEVYGARIHLLLPDDSGPHSIKDSI